MLYSLMPTVCSNQTCFGFPLFFHFSSSHYFITGFHGVSFIRQSWTLALQSLPAERFWRKWPPSTLSSFLLRQRSEFWQNTRRRWKGLEGQMCPLVCLQNTFCQRLYWWPFVGLICSLSQGWHPCHVQQPWCFFGSNGFHTVHTDPRRLFVSSEHLLKINLCTH